MAPRRPSQKENWSSPWQKERDRENSILLGWQRDSEFKRSHKDALKMYEAWKKEAQYAGEWIPGWAGKVI